MSNEKYNYEYILDEDSVKQGTDSHCKLLRMVKPESTVLECGPAYGLMTRYLKENLNCTVNIIEYDKDSFEHAIQYADGGVCADIEDNSWLEQFDTESFDYIIYADILEHLRNPQAVLEKMKSFLKPEGSVLLSVPNVAHGDIIMNLLCDRFNYTPTGLLDNSHIHFFARENLWEMVERAGYYIAEESCTRSDLYATEQGQFLAHEYYEQAKQFFSAYPNIDIYQFICRLTKNATNALSDVGIVLDKEQQKSPFYNFFQNHNFNTTKIFMGKIYFDCGSGFSEKLCKTFHINLGSSFCLHISLPDDCHILRFDPVEGYGCLIWNLQVRTESQFLQVQNHNGIVLNDVYVFRTTDPQIYLENLPAGSRRVEIKAEIICFEQSAWTKLVQEIETEKLAKANLLTEKENIRVEHLQAMQQAEAEKVSLRQSYEQTIADNLQTYEHNLQEQKQQFAEDMRLKEKSFAAEQIKAENDFRQKIVKQNKVLLDVQQEMSNIIQQKDTLQQELEKYKEHYAAAIGQRNDLQGQLAAAQYAYNIISNAFFWKITKPARVVMDCLKYPFKKSRRIRLVGKGLRCLKENGVHYTWNKVQQKLKHQQDFTKAVSSAYSDADLAQQRQVEFGQDVKFSILTPLYNTPENFLCEMIQSVVDQTYANWELCLADGSDEQHKYVGKICRQYAKKDSRVKYKKLEQNLGISANTNACIEMSTGDYIGLLDHDDLLHPAALYENMQVICNQGADFIYTDEATFASPDINKIITAHFKPDFAPDNLRANNYICHFSVFSRNILDKVKGFLSDYDGSQDHDFILRATEQAANIVHISKILYYWRSHPNSVSEDIGSKLYAIDAGKRAVRDHIKRFGMNAVVESSYAFPTIYRIQYDILEEPLVSIIIPNRNHYNDLRRCIESLISLTTYKKYEIIIVDNGSNESDILSYYSDLREFCNIRILEWDYPFNFSAINNYAAKYAEGDHLLFLNSDTKIIAPEWLEEMLMYSQRQDVGAVGAKLYYDDDTIQHAGVIIGMGSHGVAGHAFHRFSKGDVGYMGRLYFAQNYSAVTAACMMVRRDVWDTVGGFDESLAVAYNDVDLCMRISKAGYLIVWTPYAELYHYESKSRGYEDTPEKQRRLENEADRFKNRWAKELAKGDPFYNSNLTLDKGDFSLK